jgi:hypothetical protein
MTRKPGGMPVVSFSIEPEQRSFVRDLAKRLGVPESRIFREALSRFMRDPNHNLHMQNSAKDEEQAA